MYKYVYKCTYTFICIYCICIIYIYNIIKFNSKRNTRKVYTTRVLVFYWKSHTVRAYKNFSTLHLNCNISYACAHKIWCAKKKLIFIHFYVSFHFVIHVIFGEKLKVNEINLNLSLFIFVLYYWKWCGRTLYLIVLQLSNTIYVYIYLKWKPVSRRTTRRCIRKKTGCTNEFIYVRELDAISALIPYSVYISTKTYIFM